MPAGDRPSALGRALLVGAALAGVAAHAGAQTTGSLSDLSLEELLRVEVTSVSRKPQSLDGAPAAIFVITRDDIRSSGLSTLPEVLRLVPGVQVARYSNAKWSVSARGMGVYYASKLLVLVDGRSIYTPDFSGVYWDLHELMLEDVERIEVIRGPGGTMWGANAVNGVINIITRSARATTGGHMSLTAGSTDRLVTAVRYGDTVGEQLAYRVYGKFSGREFDSFHGARDSLRMGRAGFRVDYGRGRDELTLQGDAYSGVERTPSTFPRVAPPHVALIEDRLDVGGGNLLGRWSRTAASGRSLTVGAYYDRNVRNEYINDMRATVLDVDLQQRLRLGPRHDVLWGTGFRRTQTSGTPGEPLHYDERLTSRHLLSAFVQDEIALHRDLTLVVGTKVERHDMVGVAVQPNVRAVWTPAPRQTIWTAAARGVRTPSLADQNTTLDYTVVPPSPATRGLPMLVQVVGSPVQHMEQIVAYEAGYRVRPTRTLAIDVAAFWNEYDHLTSYSRGAPSLRLANGTPHLVLPSLRENDVSGESHGLEALATWTPAVRWSLSGSATLLDTNLRVAESPAEPGDSLRVLLMSPRVQLTTRSVLRITRTVDADVSLHYVGPWQTGDVSGYTRADVRLGWQATSALSIDAGIQNLLQDRHLETTLYLYTTPTPVPRSAYARVAWTF